MPVNEEGSDTQLAKQKQAAVETAEELREDLEAIAESDLPFAHDAEQILTALEHAKQNK